MSLKEFKDESVFREELYKQGDKFGILLQYADSGTLDEYFLSTPPPVSTTDIHVFFSSLLKLLESSLDIQGGLHDSFVGLVYNYVLGVGHAADKFQYSWHGDIKPANILDTFRKDSDSPASQTVDAWALGCVFLEAMVFVRNGRHGLENFGNQGVKCSYGELSYILTSVLCELILFLDPFGTRSKEFDHVGRIQSLRPSQFEIFREQQLDEIKDSDVFVAELGTHNKSQRMTTAMIRLDLLERDDSAIDNCSKQFIDLIRHLLDRDIAKRMSFATLRDKAQRIEDTLQYPESKISWLKRFKAEHGLLNSPTGLSFIGRNSSNLSGGSNTNLDPLRIAIIDTGLAFDSAKDRMIKSYPSDCLESQGSCAEQHTLDEHGAHTAGVLLKIVQNDSAEIQIGRNRGTVLTSCYQYDDDNTLANLQYRDYVSLVQPPSARTQLTESRFLWLTIPIPWKHTNQKCRTCSNFSPGP